MRWPQGAGARGGAGAPAPAVPAAAAPTETARHLLGLPEDVELEEVELLALSWFPHARWQVRPAPLSAGVLRLSPLTTVAGPYATPAGRLPDDTSCVLDVVTARHREGPPHPGTTDRDGIGRCFPLGLPAGPEAEVARWLVAVARRLRGSVLVDGRHVAVPDPEASVDLTVYTDVWLDPSAALAVVREIEPGARPAGQGADWAGPPDGIAARDLSAAGGMTLDQRRAVQEAAEHRDLEVLSAGVVLDGYGVEVDLGRSGVVHVEVAGEGLPPVSLQGLPWARTGAVAYRVRWLPEDDRALHLEHVGPELAAARAHAAALIVELARALHAAVGGEIADDADFLIDPEGL